jgi:energy-coupling factor transporter ATP-binding protein EcfA2
MKEKALPIKHISARVPWHDNKWNGTFCCKVLDNSFCRILPKIDGEKNPINEKDGAKIQEDNFPPCISEKGTFMSPFEYTRELKHAWTDINKMFKEFQPAKYHHKPFSFNAVPFLWMMKSKSEVDTKKDPSDSPHRSIKAEMYELDYRADLEEEVDQKLDFKGNMWVQHPHNQEVLLNSFFECLKPKQSLVFFYAKHTPLSEQNERLIIGVAKVATTVGKMLEYNYPSNHNGHRSYPWDRCVEHTLTENSKDGFLLPYHELIKHAETSEIDLSEFKAIAPDFEQYSYASELVEHDVAIDSLLNMAEVLKKAEPVLNVSYKHELDWIDEEISKIWDMRGAFPGMGSILSALNIDQGNTIAWEIEKYIQEKDKDLLKTNPWEIFDESIKQPTKYIKEKGAKLFNATTKRLWTSFPEEEIELFKLLSRMQLNNFQAETLFEDYEDLIGTSEEITKNLYLIYEKTAFTYKGLVSFKQIDKALLPPSKIREVFPLNDLSALSDQLDERRVRAMVVWSLEEAANEGHSILTIDDVLGRMQEKSLDEDFPINKNILKKQAKSSHFEEEVALFSHDSSEFLKLQRLVTIKEIINQKINREKIISKGYGIEKDWLEVINNYPDFAKIKLDPKSEDYKDEILARKEKAEALNTLSNYKISVLIGPAGSGKTTLLKIFELLPEIQKGGLLKLAPTGKARVKLGHDAKTIAQFLFPDRYDGLYGTYFSNEDGKKVSGAKNIVIDEASMLTEEQLAAVFDALGPVDRVILVGDYRQLPPIGTGRPFVDLVNLLKPLTFSDPLIKSGPAYTELKQIRRQANNKGEKRYDVMLSRCFGDELNKEDIELFNELSSNQIKSSHLRLEKWYDSKDFQKLIEKVLEDELVPNATEIVKEFNITLGAKDIGDYQYFNYGDAEIKIENWQIISPVNGFGYGVKEVNKFVQSTYRKNFIDLAHTKYKKKIPKPKGVDNMVYGDKVINLKNSKWEKWQQIKPYDKKEEALNYIANGEIGVITGQFKGKEYGGGEPNVEIAFSTQPGYSYVFWPDQFKEDSKKSYSFELAYAITVHKAQGSGFKKVFFVLPAKGAILSRELLYTALTRQEDKIIILHQGDFRDFIRLASTEASSTARRFTDLFFMPTVKQIDKKFYDSKYINVSERGEKMISKNEVIIANCLFKYKKQLDYAYEDKLTLDKTGRTIKPDFTIENKTSGKIFYWEHLGMMTNEQYREKWQKKLQSYLDDGFILHVKATEDDEKVLIITEENPSGGIDSKYFDELVQKYILEIN